jgi:hypothetical protein
VDEDLASDDVDLHTRLLRTTVGPWIVGLVVAVGAFWITAPNLPASAVRSRVDGWWKPAEDIGLVQDWAVFSPNPRRDSLDVRARIEYLDGTTEFWDIPEFDPGFGAYRQYRWHKFQERIRLDDHAIYWPAFAQWVADEHERDGLPPERVVLIRRWIEHQPLTADGRISDSGWNEYEFYTWVSTP